MESFFKNKGLIEVINRWKIHLAVITVVSAGIGAFVSSPVVITPKYKSTAIVYPVNIYEYSEESTTEQMLQVLGSNDIKQKMLKVFDLYKHYKIDPKEPQAYTFFIGEYDENVSINKTEYESVEIKVLDKDAKTACNMVDSIISFYDQKIASLHRRKHGEAMEISKEIFNRKSQELDSLESKLNEVRTKYGILNYGSQANEATKGEIAGNNAAKELFKNLQEQGAYSQRLDTLVWYARRDFLFFKNQYETELRELNKNISYSQIVSYPIPADKKAYPVRWAITALTVIASLIFSLIVISFIESKRKKA
jgi:capsule polysaccharide export protein KpsE/RkpR